MMKTKFYLMAIALAFIFVGCDHDQYKGVYLYGTADYNKKIESLKLTPLEALEKFNEYRDSIHPGRGLRVCHRLLINDSYAFYYIPEKTGIPVHGWYVDGNTGVVTESSTTTLTTITPYQQRRLFGKLADDSNLLTE